MQPAPNTCSLCPTHAACVGHLQPASDTCSLHPTPAACAGHLQPAPNTCSLRRTPAACVGNLQTAPDTCSLQGKKIAPIELSLLFHHMQMRFFPFCLINPLSVSVHQSFFSCKVKEFLRKYGDLPLRLAMFKAIVLARENAPRPARNNFLLPRLDPPQHRKTCRKCSEVWASCRRLSV